MISIVSPAQFLEGDSGPQNNSCLREYNGNLYYITSAQVGTTESTFHTWIMKSTDLGLTWSKIYDGTPSPTYISVTQVANILYMAYGVSASTVGLLRFDMATDTILTTATGPSTYSNRQPLITALSNGTILIAHYKSTDLTVVEVVTYIEDVGWGSNTTVTAAASHILKTMIADPSTPRAYLFLNDRATGGYVRCITITNTLTMGSLQTILTSTYNVHFGMPAIVGTASVVIPIWEENDPTWSVSKISIARATLGTNPTFSLELVENSADFTTPTRIHTFTGFDCEGIFAIYVNSTLQVFYPVSTLTNETTGAITSHLYYRSASGTTWGARATYYTPAVGEEFTTTYPLVLSTGELALLINLINPVQFLGDGTKYTSLSNIYSGPTPILPVDCAESTEDLAYYRAYLGRI